MVETFWSMVLLVFVISFSIVIMSRNEKERVERRQKTRQLLENLRAKGGNAHICAKCNGAGTIKSWQAWTGSKECEECGGLGYIEE